MNCTGCELYATERVPMTVDGRRMGEWELLTCGHGRHVWTDTRYCAWWRENHPELGEQMKLEV